MCECTQQQQQQPVKKSPSALDLNIHHDAKNSFSICMKEEEKIAKEKFSSFKLYWCVCSSLCVSFGEFSYYLTPSQACLWPVSVRSCLRRPKWYSVL